MSIYEQSAFIRDIHPFENLTSAQLSYLCDNLKVVNFKKDETLQKEGEKPKCLYIILEGLVQEKYNNEIISVYSKSEFFNPVSVIRNYAKHTFIAQKETKCYALDREIFLNILNENHAFESFFFQSVSQKLNSNINSEKNKDLTNLMLAKVKEAKVHRAVVLPFETSIYEAVKTIKKEKVPTLLLQDKKGEMFIVTDSDFREKVILERMNFDDCVGKISHSDLVYVDENDFLFNAQLLMTKHGLKRLVVKNDVDEIVGIIDQISLSSFFATHTFSVSNTIQKAQNIEELKDATKSFIKIIKSLNAKGVKVDFISKLINQLNRKMMNKLFKLTAPKKLLEKSCLIVMGSEGRGEQILKTDQDNALIVDDDCELSNEEILEYTHDYTEYLVDFGFPRCEGLIMVSNPYWCRRKQDFKKLIYTLVTEPSEENFMNLAIFYDAIAVTDNRDMIIELKEYIFKTASTSKSFCRFFAKIVMSFDVPLGFFDGFVFNSKDKEHKDEIDIKRGGIFIIVHGIRVLSLEHHLMRTNTIKRIEELEKLKELDKEFALELTEAFKFLLSIKLKFNLEKLDSKQIIDNYINPSNLTKMDKDLLKDSFKIVNKLKKKLEMKYKLNYL